MVWSWQWLQSGAAQALGWALVHSIWELAAVALVAGVVMALLRRRSPQVRYVVGCVGLVGMLALPVATTWWLWPAAVRPVVREAVASEAMHFEAMAPMRVDVAPMEATAYVAARPIPAMVRIRLMVQPWLPAMVVGYFAGACLCALRLALGFARLRQLRCRGVAVPERLDRALGVLCERLGVGRPVELLESAMIEVPTVLGYFRPVILMPVAALAGLSPGQLSGLLAHELAHIRRHDYVVNMGQTIIETLLFYHPAMWWLSGRIRQEREHCCDEMAIAASGDRLTYVRALASMETLRGPATADLALAASGGHLVNRVRRLLGVSPGRTYAVPVVVLLVLMVLAGLVFFVSRGPLNTGVEPGVAMTTTPDEGKSDQTQSGVVPTKVSIPEGGTLVIGGQKVDGQDVEMRIVAPHDIPDAMNGRTVLLSTIVGEISGEALPKDLMPEDDTHDRVVMLAKGKSLADGLKELSARVPVEVASRPSLMLNSGDKGTIHIGQMVELPGSYQQANPGDPASEWVAVNKKINLGVEGEVTASLVATAGQPPAAGDGIKLNVTARNRTMLRTETRPAPGVPADKQLRIFIPVVREEVTRASLVLEDGGTAMIIGRPAVVRVGDEAEGATTRPAGAKRLVTFVTATVVRKPDAATTQKGDAGGMGQPMQAMDKELQGKLEQPMREIHAAAQPLEEVLNLISKDLRVRTITNWDELDKAGITRATSVSVNLSNIPYRKVLATVLAEVSNDKAALGYALDSGIIVISTREDLAARSYRNIPYVSVYDIRDLLVMPDVPFNQGKGLFEAPPTQPPTGPDASRDGGVRQARIDQMIANITKTIESTVAPNSWRDQGGKVGSIRHLNGQLVVSQTMENQKEVLSLIQQLRETRSVQIAFETRFLVVPNSFMDGFRFGWDLQNPSAVATQPEQAGIPKPPEKMIIIDNWTMNLLLKMMQEEKRAFSVTAPRITIFNGQRGFLANTTQLNFVADCKVTTDGQGHAVPDLTFNTLNYGTVLEFEGTVSSDKRYVVCKIHPCFRQLESMETMPAPGTPGGKEFFIQKPVIREQDAGKDSLYSVPTGGIVLIGPVKFKGDVRTLFPNEQDPAFRIDQVATKPEGDTEYSILTLMSPRIIRHDVESDLFGPGYDRPTAVPATTPGR